MSKPAINICLIGQKFMGRAHSNAYLKAPKFFDLPVDPVMHTVAAQDKASLESFAKKWGWKNASTNWREDAEKSGNKSGGHHRPEPYAPRNGHRRAGSGEARRLRKAAGGDSGRCPADARCRQEIQEIENLRLVELSPDAGGRAGVRAGPRRERSAGFIMCADITFRIGPGPDVPLIWRFDKKVAGSGSHGDLGAHIIDMARFISGEEITEINGAITETFIKERLIPSVGSAGGIAGGAKSGRGKKGKVEVDDATLFLCRFSGGAVGSFEATRFSTGYQNKNGVEIHGEKGAISFNFEDMNHLSWFDNTADAKVKGWTKIMVTHAPDHPYAHAWWPDAHIIGYEHTFINQAADIMMALGGEKPTIPLSDFEDAYETQRVLEAVSVSAAERRPVKLAEIQ